MSVSVIVCLERSDGKEVKCMNKGLGYIQAVLDFILKLISFFKKDEDTDGSKA